MKNLFAVLVFAVTVQAHADVLQVNCQSVVSTNLGASGLYVKTDRTRNELSYALVRAGQKPNAYSWVNLKITAVNPMFPVTTITASKDMRPVDGPYVEATLAIQTEQVNPETGARPARLTLQTSPARGTSVQTQKYQTACTLR